MNMRDAIETRRKDLIAVVQKHFDSLRARLEDWDLVEHDDKILMMTIDDSSNIIHQIIELNRAVREMQQIKEFEIFLKEQDLILKQVSEETSK